MTGNNKVAVEGIIAGNVARAATRNNISLRMTEIDVHWDEYGTSYVYVTPELLLYVPELDGTFENRIVPIPFKPQS